ncbi:MAG: septum formation family protein, partial [Actinomyces oris]|uniref:septum formation family protein n=1 Tax=Actinomyces oris TaxID=544580 RepID=UPI0036143594
DDPMRTNIPSLIALPMALLLAVSLSACDEEAVGTPSTRPSSSATADPTDSSKDEPSRGSDATPSATPQADASASSSAKAEGGATTVDIQDLKTGNCISEMVNGTEQGGTEATGAKLVDCATPHQYEVTGTGQSTASTYAEATTSDEVTAVCAPVLESYVGSPSKAKKYQAAALTPSQSSWDQGDHSLTCFAQNRDNTPLNNSIKNS